MTPTRAAKRDSHGRTVRTDPNQPATAAAEPVAIRATAPQTAPSLAAPTPMLLASIQFLHKIHSYRDIAAAVFQLQTEAAAVAAAAAKKLEVKK